MGLRVLLWGMHCEAERFCTSRVSSHDTSPVSLSHVSAMDRSSSGGTGGKSFFSSGLFSSGCTALVVSADAGLASADTGFGLSFAAEASYVALDERVRDTVTFWTSCFILSPTPAVGVVMVTAIVRREA